MLDVVGLKVEIDGVSILHGVDLHVDDGEVVAVLGASGSGKTTLLRAIAGLVTPVSGRIEWNGADLSDTPIHERRFGLMFQGYALFPHLDVAGNVGFGVPAAGRETRVARALGWVHLEAFGHRRIEDLSGGEKQRVALARTLAPEPDLVMLDEPLGALDRNLRERLIIQTRQLLKDRGVTGIVVTHDRDEAAALSDRLALIHHGRIVQTGLLEELLESPADPWVREFLG